MVAMTGKKTLERVSLHPWLYIIFAFVVVQVVLKLNEHTPLLKSTTKSQHADCSTSSYPEPAKSDEAAAATANRPFQMPLSGARYEIFQPFFDMDLTKLDMPFLYPPEHFVPQMEKRLAWLDGLSLKGQEEESLLCLRQRSINAYLEVLKGVVSGVAYGQSEKSVSHVSAIEPFDLMKRVAGRDWTYLGDTMTGWLRLDNVQMLLEDVFHNNIPGDYIETGVWRGGSSQFARAVMRAHNQKHRISYVCDSFAGLPPGDRSLDRGDRGWDNRPYLEASKELVASGFQRDGLLDENVVFVKGFFNDTMPHLAPKVNRLAVMRLDGDMYESTVDVLYHLYEKLSIGGYVIMDDWTTGSKNRAYPSKRAVEDFFKVHGIKEEVIPLEDLRAAYWKKTQDVQVQMWRYEQSKFKK